MVHLKYKLDRRSLNTMYQYFIQPILEYGNLIWGGSYDTDINNLERINIDAMRLVSGAVYRSNLKNLYDETSFVTVRS